MPSPQTTHHLTTLLLNNPWIMAAYYDHPEDPREIHIYTNAVENLYPCQMPPPIKDLPVIEHNTPIFRPLICRPNHNIKPQSNVECQDEPIKLGTQIQPAGSDWVGTAGLPVRWPIDDQKSSYGILSNWHVMAAGHEQFNRPQHQPTHAFGLIARLHDWMPIDPDGPNHIDAAIADALVNGYHTIANQILDIGVPAPQPTDATVGTKAQKSGRTTGLTRGTCTAVGAAVRVGYPLFTAVFTDQDIYSGDNQIFSAPGDSGSAILSDPQRQPMSLLFAGSSDLTVGNPIRYVTEAFNLKWPFSPPPKRSYPNV